MAEEGDGLRPLTLQEAGARLGGYRWLERRLFEVTGRWAADDEVPAAQLYFDRLSTEHGWHAELWAERLPVLDGIDPEALTKPPDGAAAEVLARLEEAGRAPEQTVVRLAGLARVVLPRLVGTYRAHLEATTPAADRPVARALRLVLADVRPAWEEGEALLERLLGGAADAERAAQSQLELEILLAGTGRSGFGR